MFNKILIANRGEIACRVIRTARRMGIKTVAVYSDADARAPHVRMADESVRLGPPPASRKLPQGRADHRRLQGDRGRGRAPRLRFPVASARASPRRWPRRGSPSSGRRRKPSRRWATRSNPRSSRRKPGVNIVPGHLDDIATTDEAVKIAKGIGYPVMMKASAGGGGKGMRLAYTEKDVREGFESVKHEGLASFGDDRVFIEKFIEAPRHIEIQVLGDQHGNIVYLGERECSIQRRHQKVVEEAPSPFVTPEDAQEHGRAGGRARPGGRILQRRHGRADRQRRRPERQELLLPGDEHPAAGRASGDRGSHRPRPGRADDPRGGGREAGVHAKGREARRLGGRDAGLCRGPVSRVPAEHRAAGAVPAATPPLDGEGQGWGDVRRRGRRHRHPHPTLPHQGGGLQGSNPRRRRRRRGRRGQHVLRPDDRQADQLGADPRGGDRRAGRGARRFPDRGHRQQPRLPLGADAPPALPLGRHHHRLHRRGISGRLRRRARRTKRCTAGWRRSRRR